MKRITIGFCDFWNGFDRDNFILVKALRENYEVEILNNPSEADYVFFSVFGDEHWFLPDRCIKIFYTGENICPDFNACDYAVGFEWLDFGDRYLRLPNYLATPFFRKSALLMEEKHLIEVSHKEKFCSFVVSQESGNPSRFDIYCALSEYKPVSSGGRWKNNIGGPVSDKMEFQSLHKFAIAGENASHSGYTTEKLVEAFAAGCVPIYWGDPEVTRVFNPKAFVNAHDYASLKSLVEEVKRIDNNDDAYAEMLKQPALLHPQTDGYLAMYQKAVFFMQHIVESGLSRNVLRCRDEWGTNYIARQVHLLENERKNWKTLLKEIIIKRL